MMIKFSVVKGITLLKSRHSKPYIFYFKIVIKLKIMIYKPV